MDRSNTRCPFVLCITVEYLLSHWCKLQRHITICSCNIFIYSKKTVIAIKDLFLQSRFPSYQYHAGMYFIMTSTTSSRKFATYTYYLLFWRVVATSKFLLHLPLPYSHSCNVTVQIIFFVQFDIQFIYCFQYVIHIVT